MFHQREAMAVQNEFKSERYNNYFEDHADEDDEEENHFIISLEDNGEEDGLLIDYDESDGADHQHMSGVPVLEQSTSFFNETEECSSFQKATAVSVQSLQSPEKTNMHVNTLPSSQSTISQSLALTMSSPIGNLPISSKSVHDSYPLSASSLHPTSTLSSLANNHSTDLSTMDAWRMPDIPETKFSTYTTESRSPFYSSQLSEMDRNTSCVTGLTGSTISYQNIPNPTFKKTSHSDASKAELETIQLDNDNSMWSEAIFLSKTSGVSDSSMSNCLVSSKTLYPSSTNYLAPQAIQSPSEKAFSYVMQNESGRQETHFSNNSDILYSNANNFGAKTSHIEPSPIDTSNESSKNNCSFNDCTEKTNGPVNGVSGCTCIMCYKGRGIIDSNIEPTFDLPFTQEKALSKKPTVKRKRSSPSKPVVTKKKSIGIIDSRSLSEIRFIDPSQMPDHVRTQMVQNNHMLHYNVDHALSSLEQKDIENHESLYGKEAVNNAHLPTILYRDPVDNGFISKSLSTTQPPSVENISGTSNQPYILPQSGLNSSKHVIVMPPKEQLMVTLPTNTTMHPIISNIVSVSSAISTLPATAFKSAPTKVFLKPPRTQHESYITPSPSISKQATNLTCPPLRHKTQKSGPAVCTTSSSIPASVKVASSPFISTSDLKDYKIVYVASNQVVLLPKSAVLDTSKKNPPLSQTEGKPEIRKREIQQKPVNLNKISTQVCEDESSNCLVKQNSKNSQQTSGAVLDQNTQFTASDNPNRLKFVLNNAERVDLSSPGQVMIRLKQQHSPKSPSLSPQVSPRIKIPTQPITVLNSPPKTSVYITSLLNDTKMKEEVKSPDKSTILSLSALLTENGPAAIPPKSCPVEQAKVETPSRNLEVTQTLLRLINSHFHDQKVNEKALLNYLKDASKQTELSVSQSSDVCHSKLSVEPLKSTDAQITTSMLNNTMHSNVFVPGKVLALPPSRLDVQQPRLPQEGLPSTYVEDWVNQAKSFRAENIEEDYSCSGLKNFDQSVSAQHFENQFKGADLITKDSMSNSSAHNIKPPECRDDSNRDTLILPHPKNLTKLLSQNCADRDTMRQNIPAKCSSSSKDNNTSFPEGPSSLQTFDQSISGSKFVSSVSSALMAKDTPKILTKAPLKRSASCFASRETPFQSTKKGPSSSVVSCSKGIKLKIRLNKLKRKKAKKFQPLHLLSSKINTSSEEPLVSGEQENIESSNSSPVTNISGKIGNEAKPTDGKEKVETAEEMFQRFQEQAMQEVFKAQLGVGYLSRSLRPTRTSASFSHKFSSKSDSFTLQKKKVDDEKCALAENNKCNTSEVKTDDFKITCAKNLVETNKRRFAERKNQQVKVKKPKLSIRDYPKLKEDESIAHSKKLFCSHILAAHQVYVRFNTFENEQSGRSFLVPFFNFGGTRTQFDVEDVNYINKAVAEFEKEDRTCARHLLFHSRAGKKASFLRKETNLHTNLINDGSYKKSCFILEGFKRDAPKPTVPPPEKWKVDNKVDIEIDTADVDNDIEIGFENCESNELINGLNDFDAAKIDEGHRLSEPEDYVVMNETNNTSHCPVNSDLVKSANPDTSNKAQPFLKLQVRPNILKKRVSLAVKRNLNESEVQGIFPVQNVTETNLKTVSNHLEDSDNCETSVLQTNGEGFAYTKKLQELMSHALHEEASQNDGSDLPGTSILGVKSKDQSANSITNYNTVTDETLRPYVISPTNLLQVIKNEIVDDGYEEAINPFKSNAVETRCTSSDVPAIPPNPLQQHDSDISRVTVKKEPMEDFFVPQTNSSSSVQPEICGAKSLDRKHISAGANECDMEELTMSLDKDSAEKETPQEQSGPEPGVGSGDTTTNVIITPPSVKDKSLLSAADECNNRQETSTPSTVLESATEHPTSNSPTPSSSSVSESSEILSSSDCDSEDSEDDNECSTSLSTAVTDTCQLSPDLSGAPKGDESRNNSGQSKITSLVESLRQRLLEQTSSLPSWLADKNEPENKAKKKKRKKKRKKNQEIEEGIRAETKPSFDDTQFKISETATDENVSVSVNSNSTAAIPAQTYSTSLTDNSAFVFPELSPCAVRPQLTHDLPAPSVDLNQTITLSSKHESSPSKIITLPSYGNSSSKSSMLLPVILPKEANGESNRTDQDYHKSVFSLPTPKESAIMNRTKDLSQGSSTPAESFENVKSFVVSLRDSDSDASCQKSSLLLPAGLDGTEKPKCNVEEMANTTQQTENNTDECLSLNRSSPVDFDIDVGLEDLPETSLTFKAILPEFGLESDHSRGNSVNDEYSFHSRVTQTQYFDISGKDKKQKGGAKKKSSTGVELSFDENSQKGSVTSYLCKKFALNEGSQMSHIVKGPRLLHMRRNRPIAAAIPSKEKVPEQTPQKPVSVATEPISTAELSKVPTLSEIFGVAVETDEKTEILGKTPKDSRRESRSKEHASQVARKRTSQRKKIDRPTDTENKKVTPECQPSDHKEEPLLSSLEKAKNCNSVVKPQRKLTRAQKAAELKGNVDGKFSIHDLKPCRVLLERIDSNSIANAQQGRNILKVKEEPRDEESVKGEELEYNTSDAASASSKPVTKRVIKKKKKKSTKMSRRAVPRVKQDIVDYYTSVLEALQKKALLLEEESRRKEEEKKLLEEPKEQLKVDQEKDDDKKIDGTNNKEGTNEEDGKEEMKKVGKEVKENETEGVVEAKSNVQSEESCDENKPLDGEGVDVSKLNVNNEGSMEQTLEKTCGNVLEPGTYKNECSISNNGQHENEEIGNKIFTSQPSLQNTAFGESSHSQTDRPFTAGLAVDQSPGKSFEKKDVVLCSKEDELDHFSDGDLLNETEEAEASLLAHICDFEDDMGTVPQEEVEKLLGLDISENTTFNNMKSVSGTEYGIERDSSGGGNFAGDNGLEEQSFVSKDKIGAQQCHEALKDESMSSSLEAASKTLSQNISLLLPSTDSEISSETNTPSGDETAIPVLSEAASSKTSQPAKQPGSLVTGESFKFKFKLPTGLLTKAIKMSKELKNVFGEGVSAEETTTTYEEKAARSEAPVSDSNCSEVKTTLLKPCENGQPVDLQCQGGDFNSKTQNVDEEMNKDDESLIPKYKLKLGPHTISAIQTAKTQFLNKRKGKKGKGKTKLKAKFETSDCSGTSDLQFQQDIEFYLRISEKGHEGLTASESDINGQAVSDAETKPESGQNQIHEMMERKGNRLRSQNKTRITRSNREASMVISEKQSTDKRPSSKSPSNDVHENSLIKDLNLEIDTEGKKDEGLFSHAEIFKTIKNEAAPDTQEPQKTQIKVPEAKSKVDSFLKSKAIDISKLKMKLNPLLASRLGNSHRGERPGANEAVSSKNKESSVNVNKCSGSSSDSQNTKETLHLQGVDSQRAARPIEKEPSEILSATLQDNIVKEPTQSTRDNLKVLSHSSSDLHETKPLPMLNTTKLCNILKNFQSKVHSDKNSNVTSKTSEDNLVSNAITTRSKKNKTKQGLNQDTNTPLRMKAKRGKDSKVTDVGELSLGRSLRKRTAVSGSSSSLTDDTLVKKEEKEPSCATIDSDDKGERSFFDCLSNFSSDVWEQL